MFLCFNLIGSWVLTPLADATALATPVPMPEPGRLWSVSKLSQGSNLRGLQYDANNPMSMTFLFDAKEINNLKEEDYLRVVKYFMAGLTIPEGDLWVNLSPYEKNRIAPESLSLTALGRDLLAQDYLLKQVAASLYFPESKTGGEFWKDVYQQESRLKSPSSNRALFNKVWIVADDAEVYVQHNMVVLVKATLKVMLEDDYLAMFKNYQSGKLTESQVQEQERIKKIIIPELEKDINEGENFAVLRQIYHAMILAKWFKEQYANGFLSQTYHDKTRLKGIDDSSLGIRDNIFERYLKAYKKGAFNYIAPDDQDIMRKYFSGGMRIVPAKINEIPTVARDQGIVPIRVDFNRAMTTRHLFKGSEVEINDFSAARVGVIIAGLQFKCALEAVNQEGSDLYLVRVEEKKENVPALSYKEGIRFAGNVGDGKKTYIDTGASNQVIQILANDKGVFSFKYDQLKDTMIIRNISNHIISLEVNQGQEDRNKIKENFYQLVMHLSEKLKNNGKIEGYTVFEQQDLGVQIKQKVLSNFRPSVWDKEITEMVILDKDGVVIPLRRHDVIAKDILSAYEGQSGYVIDLTENNVKKRIYVFENIYHQWQEKFLSTPEDTFDIQEQQAYVEMGGNRISVQFNSQGVLIKSYGQKGVVVYVEHLNKETVREINPSELKQIDLDAGDRVAITVVNKNYQIGGRLSITRNQKSGRLQIFPDDNVLNQQIFIRTHQLTALKEIMLNERNKKNVYVLKEEEMTSFKLDQSIKIALKGLELIVSQNQGYFFVKGNNRGEFKMRIAKGVEGAEFPFEGAEFPFDEIKQISSELEVVSSNVFEVIDVNERSIFTVSLNGDQLNIRNQQSEALSISYMDRAMNAAVLTENKGGIDFNQMAINESGIKGQTEKSNTESQQIEGLFPVIVSIASAVRLETLLQ